MIRLPPEEAAARRRARDAAKKRRKRARQRIVLTQPVSKTSALYRKHLPRLPEMTKGELRAMLSQAVANTGTRMAANA